MPQPPPPKKKKNKEKEKDALKQYFSSWQLENSPNSQIHSNNFLEQEQHENNF